MCLLLAAGAQSQIGLAGAGHHLAEDLAHHLAENLGLLAVVGVHPGSDHAVHLVGGV